MMMQTTRVAAVATLGALFAAFPARADTTAPVPTQPVPTQNEARPSSSPPTILPPPPQHTPPPSPSGQPLEHAPPPVAAVAPVAAASLPAGDWVFTQQYGWLWMPYDRAYTHVVDDAALAYEYAYYPSFGWRWVVAPWVLGFGVSPYWGALGPARFTWYAHPWFRVGTAHLHPSWGHVNAPTRAFGGGREFGGGHAFGGGQMGGHGRR